MYWVGTVIILVIIGILAAILRYVSLSGNGKESVDNERITLETRNITRFRAEIETLVSERKYHQATEALLTTEVTTLVDQAVTSRDLRWMAVYEDTLVLPGLAESIVIQSRSADYWVIPGTSDAIIDARWQTTATDFAERFNRGLQQAKKD
ncbi:hypothetical protein C5Y96_07110 [Blastopirellula marina]|uniref:Uncharacterized protein n=2 Tax=Pirellulales TaxID=2691354 RepID=A0A2S8FYK0_9BACT|nr:hypothetical protein C5Y96_07110 [Blastopirellula marina]RCS53639.1 hypothetical protein DTL36_07120 [Bremerella cremea]